MSISLLPKLIFSTPFPPSTIITTSRPSINLSVKAFATSTTTPSPAKLTKDYSVEAVKARQIIDNRGNPTVEVDVFTGDGHI
ncbi:hypothetical protein SOVF_081550 [Spinacia oleracea]|nr:hypothetical protein SOVF_081550 [Spinacia oleracea]